MDIIQKTSNYLKSLTAETISNAKSGHSGTALGASTLLLSLFHEHLIFNPKDPMFLNRDRFVLSAGHASGLYYTLLHMFGYDVSMNDLKQFRTYGSKTPGHPELGVVPGCETSTGPLGQGVANAVGLAIGETIMESRFNTKTHPLFNNYTYCFAGDGCLMEGVAMEACAIAGTLNLNKLILLYDNNNITIEGSRNIASTENIALKFKAMGWDTIEAVNGNNYTDVAKAIAKAKKNSHPTIIIFKTIIGLGTKKQGLAASHAMPLSPEDLKEFKDSLGVSESFFVPQDVYNYCNETVSRNMKIYESWKNMLEDYKQKFPDKFKELHQFFTNKKINYQSILNELEKQGEMAGRNASHFCLNKIAAALSNFVGGTADLAPSTLAFIENGGDYSAANRLGKNFHYGIREHAMGSISNGLALYSNFYVFDSTFLSFSNYMQPAIRMRAMMNIPVVSVFTHDSVDIGQDGPTHQPIEQLGTLRQTIGLNVVRPATNAELVFGYKLFVESKSPTALVVSKSKLPKFEASTLENAEHGAYVIFETKTKPTIEIFATGVDTALAVSVAKELEEYGARVISMPCEKIFDSSDKAYKNKVLLKNAALKVAIEASNDPIWFKYIGTDGLLISVDDYQKSGSGKEVYEKAGFNVKDILKKIKSKLK